jgi:tetratricopeptide (TPR) repeat protein
MKSAAFNLYCPVTGIFLISLVLLTFIVQPLSAQITGPEDKAKLELFEDAITKGEQFLAAKDYAKAKAEYQKALIIDPSAKYPKDKLTFIRKFYIDPADEARYAQAMESGNRFMDAADYASARNQFEIAVNIKPEEKTARDKMAEAEKLDKAKQENIKQYNKLIAEADKLFAGKDMTGARAAYDAASKIDQSASYPRQRIGEIDAKAAADKALKDSYEQILSDGDEAYMNRDYTTARLKYEQALKIKPGENYPKSMLERVSEGSANLKDAQQNYQVAIASADKLYNAKDYETALTAYQNASKILPGEKYPSEQIEKINSVLDQKKKLDEEYAKTIASGNQLFDKKQYAEAKHEFQKANDLKPGEAYPKQKIDEIAGILLALKEAERSKEYAKAVAEADVLFNSKDYANALAKYQEAADIKSEEPYPNEKIAFINKFFADEQAARSAYEKAITDADLRFTSSAWEEAIVLYESALKQKPGELYPSQQITKARESIASERQKEESFNQAVASADKLLGSEDYNGAMNNYQQALTIKPGSTYPQDQIAKINTILASKKSQDEQYQKLITDGDKLFQSGSLQEAVSSYNQALALKTQEKYPSDQIVKINKQLDEIAAQQAAYTQKIIDADKLFGESKFEQALAEYQKAQLIRPSEKYPQEKIETINSILEQRKSLEENYARNMREGEKAYTSNDLEIALNSYKQAKALKPDEKLPQDRIDLIEKKIAEFNSLNADFQGIIADADSKFNTAEYDEAIVLYQSAIKLKPSENYPAEQIRKAQDILTSNKQKEESYTKAIALADKFKVSGDLEEAIRNYEQALAIKPAEVYPQEQITNINATLSANRSKDEQYQKLITDGDKLFQSGSLQEAVSAYNQALVLKSQEKYPSDQITKINKQIDELKAKEAAYNQHITSADKLYGEAKYELALPEYQKALLIQPSEVYPQEKITAINNIIEQRKSLEENYTKSIAEGDKAITAGNLDIALSAFENAKALKPAEKYPQEKINQIEKSLADQKTKTDNYLRVVADADRSFNSGELDAASIKYKEAKDIKPNESYPQEQIGKINNIIAANKEKNETYRNLIAEADRLYNQKSFDPALGKYQEALALMPSEAWPGQQISKINAQKGEIAQAEQAYTEAIQRADGLFSKAAWDESTAAYNDALKLKPSEKYPKDQIALIGLKKAELKTLQENYQTAITEADRLYEVKEYGSALVSYQKALELKPVEAHPAFQIAAINSILAEQKQLADKGYNEAIENANRLFSLQDYTSARKFYENASALKPGEAYPKNKLIEINTILMERSRNQMDAYNKIIMKADQAYQDKILDQAIDAYEEAGIAKPDETYPYEMIRKIRKYMEEHAMVDLVSEPIIITSDSEQKFKFKPIEMRLRKNNYVIIKARKTGETEPKVYINYGIDGQKSGGIVLRSIKSQETGDYIVRVSIQDRWYRLDNNWISIYSEGGEVEISRMQISQGD